MWGENGFKGKWQVDSQLLSWSLTKKNNYSLNPELTYEIDPSYTDDKVRLHTIRENLLQGISKLLLEFYTSFYHLFIYLIWYN